MKKYNIEIDRPRDDTQKETIEATGLSVKGSSIVFYDGIETIAVYSAVYTTVKLVRDEKSRT